MDRRSFLRGLGMVVAGVAIDQAIPLGRVWSFPSNVVRCTTRNFRIPMRFDPNCPPDSIYLLRAGDLRAAQLNMIESIRNVSFDPLDLWIHPEQERAYAELAAPDSYALIRDEVLRELENTPPFRITGITVPQGE